MALEKQTITKYWKYLYEDWVQPKLTSNNSSNCLVTSNSEYNGYPAYYVMDGTSKSWFPNTTTGWWQIKLPQKVYIFGLTHKAGGYNNANTGIIGRYYTSSNMSTPIGDVINISGNTAYGTEVAIQGIPDTGILTDTIYFNKTGGNTSGITTHPANTGIQELIINAKTRKIIEGTHDNYDFTTTETKYVVKTKNEQAKRYWKKYFDWTQPDTLTSSGTIGGTSFATSESSYFGNRPFYTCFGGDGWHSDANLPQWVSWYNPTPLRVSSINFKGASAGNIKTGTIQASDDNSNWVDICPFNNLEQTGDFDIVLPKVDKGYKYWRIYITDCYYYYSNKPYPLIASGLIINAIEEENPIEVTESDNYDYTTTGVIHKVHTVVDSTYYDSDGNVIENPEKTVHYWKWKDWVQPKLTSNNQDDIEVTASEGTQTLYEALDGITQMITHNTNEGNGWNTGTATTGWWQVKFPYKLKISSMTYYTNIFHACPTNIEGQFYTSSSKSVPIGKHLSTPYGEYYGVPHEIKINIPIITDTIYFVKESGHTYAGMGELEIGAQVLVEVSENDEYDFKTEEINCAKTINRYTTKIYST